MAQHTETTGLPQQFVAAQDILVCEALVPREVGGHRY